MKANKAYKYRIYPNEEQKVFFAKTFGCVRFVYNKMLSEKIEYYEQTHKTLHNTPAHLKKEYPWLKEVDSLALVNAQLQLQTAFANFFRNEKTGFPKYRSKKGSRKSYTTNNQRGTIRLQDGRLRLPKVSPIRIKLHRLVPDGYTIKSVTVSQEPSGKYYASVLTEYEAEPQHVAVRPEYSLGLDYSSPHFYVDSNGEVADMPHYYRNAELKLAKEQRKLSKMVRGSNNYWKQRVHVALAYEKVRNCRKDWQHKESSRLAEQYDLIAVEDINYQDMAQNLKLAKATYDNGFGQFRNMLAYKMASRGKEFITIDKWFPSSKRCNICGHINTEMILSDREWNCPNCGNHLLRDHNAAINIRNAGLALLK